MKFRYFLYNSGVFDECCVKKNSGNASLSILWMLSLEYQEAHDGMINWNFYTYLLGGSGGNTSTGGGGGGIHGCCCY